MKQIEVVFCGNSLYLSVLATSLQYKNQFRICMMEQQPVQAIPELKMLCPEVLIFEDGNYTVGMIDPLLIEKFQLVIIVVHPKTDSVEVLCKEERWTASVDNLGQVIRKAVLSRKITSYS